MPGSNELVTSLYWTDPKGLRRVAAAMKHFRTLLISGFLSFFALSVQAQTRTAQAVSADDAHNAVARGAFVVDVRSAPAFDQGHLPLAVSLASDAAALPLAQLAQVLSQAGIDTSRTVVVVGEAGDANAAALWQRLAQVSSGRVLWLVGGVTEWQMRGYALSTERVTHAPVPQFLTPFQMPRDAVRMAGSKVRSSPLLERDLSIKVALAP
jgi:rhodanese-related sulfurtransferase